MALIEEAKNIVASIFGPTNAMQVDVFAQESNPEQDPEAFLEKCVQLVAGMLGQTLARKKFQSIMDRYQIKTKS